MRTSSPQRRRPSQPGAIPGLAGKVRLRRVLDAQHPRRRPRCASSTVRPSSGALPSSRYAALSSAGPANAPGCLSSDAPTGSFASRVFSICALPLCIWQGDPQTMPDQLFLHSREGWRTE
ncbi:MAG: hypothetical protein ACKN9T_05290 [Candidatus Methylumidiphilus sp.]